jgi:DNA-directed RNA polymerase subunit omega
MARVTVEDCLKDVDRFALVAVASFRAREINKGSKILVEKDNDKNAVIALREIAAGKLDPIKVKDQFIQSLRKNYNPDVLEETQKAKTELSEEVDNEIASLVVTDDEAITVENYMFDEDEVDADD